MILVTGGLGFIGLHTARALLDLGEELVLTQYRAAWAPSFIADDLGRRAVVEQLDIADLDALEQIGRRHEITAIAHLAVPGLGALSPIEEMRTNLGGLMNILTVAEQWGVTRLGVASSGSVYARTPEIPQREDVRVPLEAGNPTEAYKKSFELLAGHFADRSGVPVVNLRIAGIWGPLYHSMANFQSRAVHAAVSGVELDTGRPVYAGAGGDLCYVPDCGRGIALLMTAPELHHRTYNVGWGRPTTYGEVVDAIHAVIPDASIPLTAGADPNGPPTPSYQDLSRITEDTGYTPAYDLQTAVSEYIDWLRAGNPE